MNRELRIERAILSLQGLSLGDAFGQCFFIERDKAIELIQTRQLPDKPWLYTDDTVMATSIVETLNKFGYIDRDYLAELFAKKYIAEPNRAYGGSAGKILREISEGINWAEAANKAFSGMGSMGNGGAMRAAPIGAYFCDDYERVIKEAKASSEVTHSHPDAQAGAIAVAVAGAYCTRQGLEFDSIGNKGLLETVIELTPESDTRSRIKRAIDIPFDARLDFVISRLGNGLNLCAYDTVAIALWFVAAERANFTEALWQAVSALGDRDTICAIVGSLVALVVGTENLPEAWLKRREKLVLDF